MRFSTCPFKTPKRICYYSISLKLMVPFLQRKLLNDREERMKEEPEQTRRSRWNAGEQRQNKEVAQHQRRSQMCWTESLRWLLEGSHVHGHTHARHTCTPSVCYRWDLTQVQMLRSDLLDSPSHVNIQEWRETERGKDGWGTISWEGQVEKRYFHGDGEGVRER